MKLVSCDMSLEYVQSAESSGTYVCTYVPNLSTPTRKLWFLGVIYSYDLQLRSPDPIPRFHPQTQSIPPAKSNQAAPPPPPRHQHHQFTITLSTHNNNNNNHHYHHSRCKSLKKALPQSSLLSSTSARSLSILALTSCTSSAL